MLLSLAASNPDNTGCTCFPCLTLPLQVTIQSEHCEYDTDRAMSLQLLKSTRATLSVALSFISNGKWEQSGYAWYSLIHDIIVYPYQWQMGLKCVSFSWETNGLPAPLPPCSTIPQDVPAPMLYHTTGGT